MDCSFTCSASWGGGGCYKAVDPCNNCYNKCAPTCYICTSGCYDCNDVNSWCNWFTGDRGSCRAGNGIQCISFA